MSNLSYYLSISNSSLTSIMFGILLSGVGTALTNLYCVSAITQFLICKNLNAEKLRSHIFSIIHVLGLVGSLIGSLGGAFLFARFDYRTAFDFL